ncbi:MAG TPA: carbon-phosphorus lyase, partial [bacterium]|nr:carbon-phosphorus lyase [bacterium]
MEIMFLGTAAAEGWPGVFCSCDYCKKARELGGKNIRTRSSVLIEK